MYEHEHQELLTRANKVRAAATDGDAERLHREAEALLAGFREHADAVAASIGALPGTAAKALGQGQRLVLARLLALAAAARNGELDTRCSALGRDLATHLTLHFESERRAIGHRAGALPTAS